MRGVHLRGKNEVSTRTERAGRRELSMDNLGWDDFKTKAGSHVR